MARVLVVDDDPMIRKALTMILGERHEVVSVTGVRAAVAALAGAGFDAVLCDLQLGDGDAREVDAAFNHADRFVVITGGAVSESLARYVAGLPHVLGKPFDFDATLDLIDEVVASPVAGSS